jgi:hypothetical protein
MRNKAKNRAFIKRVVWNVMDFSRGFYQEKGKSKVVL